MLYKVQLTKRLSRIEKFLVIKNLSAEGFLNNYLISANDKAHKIIDTFASDCVGRDGLMALSIDDR